MIERAERQKMLAVPPCGPRVVARLESIGVHRMGDLARHDPWQFMHEVNLEAGRTIWRPPIAILALQNLVDASEREAGLPTRRPEDGTVAPAT